MSGRNHFSALLLEALVTIFHLVLQDCPTRRKVLMAVCSRWRCILYFNPSCNHTIDFLCVYWNGGIDDIIMLRERGKQFASSCCFPRLLFKQAALLTPVSPSGLVGRKCSGDISVSLRPDAQRQQPVLHDAIVECTGPKVSKRTTWCKLVKKAVAFRAAARRLLSDVDREVKRRKALHRKTGCGCKQR
ncbi:hypothetical protein K438DRAFT_1771124 [Mycena galopus ATCC 62051]|nr:hypothetical protein K438DRAFT_1771124 [Mycena galopus ATCC 62051]